MARLTTISVQRYKNNHKKTNIFHFIHPRICVSPKIFVLLQHKNSKIVRFRNMSYIKNRRAPLTSSQVEEQRLKYGVNKLTPPEREPLWKAFLEKFKDPLIEVLLLIMVVSMGVSVFEYVKMPDVGAEVFLEPLGVLVALLLATSVGFVFEVKASREFDVLNQVNDNTPVRVIRSVGGHYRVMEIARWEVVCGDWVSIETGDEIPADGVLLEAVSLSVNESVLTGEAMTPKYIPSEERPETEQTAYPVNQLLRGTTVIEGHGTMIVTAVGDSTEQGNVAQATQIDNGITTPLNRQLGALGKWLSKAAFIVAAAIIVGRLIWFIFLDGQDETALETIHYGLTSLMIAITLIAVAVPEGLPLSITLSLALAMRRMLKEHNLVRRLHACETMGAATVICTDKTGTLTRNRMHVEALHDYPSNSAVLAEAIAANSTAYLQETDDNVSILGNPTEGALLLWLREHGTDYLPLRQSLKILYQVPFSTESKRMETTVLSTALEGRKVTYIKGAPELLLDECDEIAAPPSGQPLSAADIKADLARYQAQAMRTLGFACRIDNGPLVFTGIAAIMDPVRDEVPEAIRTCRDAGIRVIIVTGDTQGTAVEIGRQCGIMHDGEPLPYEVMTGTQFEAMSDDDFLGVPSVRLKILCRARPLDKKRLVKLLQRQGEVVAVTGDGTNDAPALKAAHVGISMGNGTAVAKQASDITITDNSFSSIVKAVMWGRSLYKNIERFILFQMTVNVAACAVVLTGAFLGKESPLTVTQMLWVNLIMDTFAAMALSSLPADPAVMKDKPRSTRTRIINRKMVFNILGWGLLFSGILIWLWLHPLLFPHEWFFTFFVLLQFWNLINVRLYNTDMMFWNASWSKGFWSIAALILLGQWLIVTFGGQMFNIVHPLAFETFRTLFLWTLPVFLLGEMIRAIRCLRQ